MSEEKKKRTYNTRPNIPKGERHKVKFLPKYDLTEKLLEIELDDEISKKAKHKKLIKIRDECISMLNEQQQRFVTEYFVDFNMSKAGVRAGYSAEYAKSGDLMAMQPVLNYITITRKLNELKMDITAEFVLLEFNKLAKVKASDLYDEDGSLIPPHRLPDWVAAAVSEVKQKTTTLENGREIVEYTYRLHSKVAALDALGKHTGIYERDNKQKTQDAANVVVYMPDNGREAKS